MRTQRKFLAWLMALILSVSMIPTAVLAAEPCTVIEGCTLEDRHEGECVTTTSEAKESGAVEVSSEDSLRSAINSAGGTASAPTVITLTQDIELTQPIKIASKHICLKGKTGNEEITIDEDVDAGTQMFQIGTTETSQDTSVIFKNININGENHARLLVINASASVIIEGGAVLKNGKGDIGAGAIVVGHLTLNGGTISGCHATTSLGGAIYMGGGTFILQSGRISDCRSDNHGAAVAFFWNPGKFFMYGGEITNCKKSGNSDDGAIYQ